MKVQSTVKGIVEIDNIFNELSKELGIPFIKGPMVNNGAQHPHINLNHLIAHGPKGITNTQMIPAIKSNIHNVDNIKLLFHTYQTVFNNSLKYLSKGMQQRISKLLQI